MGVSLSDIVDRSLCVEGFRTGSAAVLTAAQAPRLRGARGRLRPRRPGGPVFKSPPASRDRRHKPQGLRDHPAWHHGGVENKRPQRPHPPKGAQAPDGPEDPRATTARPVEAGHEDGVPGKRQGRKRKGHAEGRPMWAARPGSFPARRP